MDEIVPRKQETICLYWWYRLWRKTNGARSPSRKYFRPLLFIIYINDLPQICPLARFILYADDANIILRADTIDQINEQLTELANRLLSWVKCNGLALNLKKTHYMIFASYTAVIWKKGVSQILKILRYWYQNFQLDELYNLSYKL